VRVSWDEDAWEEYVAWQETDRAIARKINALIASIRRTPFTGLGKPEPLRQELSGFWSRRITAEHRLVYRVSGTGEQQQVEIAQCRYHY
jgi:toxin YoeB